MIALAEKAARALKLDMLKHARAMGHTEIQASHNAVYATLPPEGARSADMAHRAGITRQSMGEIIREMVAAGSLVMVPDPTDGRAKIVKWSEHGKRVASDGFDHIVELDRVFRERFGDADIDTTYRVMLGIIEMLSPELADEPLPATVLPTVPG
ncbi:MAG: MarR family winged helix-turn-helix transcriptional regulator [Marmoricola sp.]